MCLIALAALVYRGPVDKAGFTHAGSTDSSSLHVTVQSWWIFYGATGSSLGSSGLRLSRLIVFPLAEDRPDDPGILVRQGYRGDIGITPTLQLLQPRTAPVRLVLAGFEHRTCTMDQ